MVRKEVATVVVVRAAARTVLEIEVVRKGVEAEGATVARTVVVVKAAVAKVVVPMVGVRLVVEMVVVETVVVETVAAEKALEEAAKAVAGGLARVVEEEVGVDPDSGADLV